MKSTFGTLKTRDFIKGAIIAVLVPVLLIIQQSITNGMLNWKEIGMSAVAAFVAYLLKNLATDDIKVAQNILKTAKEDAEKDAEKENKP